MKTLAINCSPRIPGYLIKKNQSSSLCSEVFSPYNTTRDIIVSIKISPTQNDCARAFIVYTYGLSFLSFFFFFQIATIIYLGQFRYFTVFSSFICETRQSPPILCCFTLFVLKLLKSILFLIQILQHCRL